MGIILLKLLCIYIIDIGLITQKLMEKNASIIPYNVMKLSYTEYNESIDLIYKPTGLIFHLLVHGLIGEKCLF